VKKFVLFALIFTGAASRIIAVEINSQKKVDFWGDEISSLAHLITANEKHLSTQKQLKDMMQLFQKQKEEFLQGNQSKNHAFSMVSNAREILTMIKEEHLSYLFSTDYLEELIFFSSVAAKSVPLKP
jgi:7-keto-8-aminopelargonate synthetase-like enzyme